MFKQPACRILGTVSLAGAFSIVGPSSERASQHLSKRLKVDVFPAWLYFAVAAGKHSSQPGNEKCYPLGTEISRLYMWVGQGTGYSRVKSNHTKMFCTPVGVAVISILVT